MSWCVSICECIFLYLLCVNVSININATLISGSNVVVSKWNEESHEMENFAWTDPNGLFCSVLLIKGEVWNTWSPADEFSFSCSPPSGLFVAKLIFNDVWKRYEAIRPGSGFVFIIFTVSNWVWQYTVKYNFASAFLAKMRARMSLKPICFKGLREWPWPCNGKDYSFPFLHLWFQFEMRNNKWTSSQPAENLD